MTVQLAVQVTTPRTPATPWPEGISDGLTIPCVDCGEVPQFDYIVTDAFWSHWVTGPDRTSVVCLSCLDRRCSGIGLADALVEVQWTGTGHTVVLTPTRRIEYAIRQPLDVMPATDPTSERKETP